MLATDDSEPARCAESWIVRLARTPPPTVDVVCIAGHGVARYGWAMQTYRAPVREALDQLRVGELLAAERIANSVGDRLQAAGLTVHAWARQGDAAEELLAMIDDEQPDLIAVGPRGRSLLSELLLGGVSHRLVAHATCPVLVARTPVTEAGPLPTRAVVVLHEGDEDAGAIRWLANSAFLATADTLILGVPSDQPALGGGGDESAAHHRRDDAAERLRRIAEPLVERTAALSHELTEDHPVEAALAAARLHDADLLVVTRPTSRPGLRPLADELARHAPCSVLVVPAR